MGWVSRFQRRSCVSKYVRSVMDAAPQTPRRLVRRVPGRSAQRSPAKARAGNRSRRPHVEPSEWRFGRGVGPPAQRCCEADACSAGQSRRPSDRRRARSYPGHHLPGVLVGERVPDVAAFMTPALRQAFRSSCEGNALAERTRADSVPRPAFHGRHPPLNCWSMRAVSRVSFANTAFSSTNPFPLSSPSPVRLADIRPRLEYLLAVSGKR